MNKNRDERILAAQKILRFGPAQAFAMALTMAGCSAVAHNWNESARDIYQEYQSALEALPAMDPDTIVPGTDATASEVFCEDNIKGKTLVRRFDNEMMSLDCGVK